MESDRSLQPLPEAGPTVAVIGAGPAGLMAAERLAHAGLQVDVYDRMPSAGRKFLLAGRGGMNLTHAEPLPQFLPRYRGSAAPGLVPVIEAFTPTDLRAWVDDLGIATFIGSSGRVFPTDMKAAPLLRAWLHRLRQQGVRFHMRHRFTGWQRDADRSPPSLHFTAPSGDLAVHADAIVLALGGASWPRMGSDGLWVPILRDEHVPVAPLRPANCGFETPWSPHFCERFAGAPVKNVAMGVTAAAGAADAAPRQGEFVVTRTGVEGGLIYALAAPLRDMLEREGMAVAWIDLLPAMDAARVQAEVSRPRGARSLSSHLQSRLGLTGVKAGLLRELTTKEEMADPVRLAHAIKRLPLTLRATRPIEEAISSAGGVTSEALDARLMLRNLPGVFCAGEMLDWEAPTGGYLLTACFATGRQAAAGAIAWVADAGSRAPT